MFIGFTYDLKDDYLKEGYTQEQVAEFDSLTTIEAVSEALERAGSRVERIGRAEALSRRLQEGAKWDLVFNICEGLHGSGRESLTPALLDAARIPYTFSDPLGHALALNKAVTKRLLKAAGLPTTDFVLIEDADKIPEHDYKFPYFLKSVSEGTGKGISPASKVLDFNSLQAQARKLIGDFAQPVIAEPFLPGREVTVGVLGSGAEAFCAGVMNVEFTGRADADIHSYFNKENCESAVHYSLARDGFADRCAAIAVAAHQTLGLKDASRADIRADEQGNPQVMEINSLPGLMPGRSDLVLLSEMAGISYQRLIEIILDSAWKRCRA